MDLHDKEIDLGRDESMAGILEHTHGYLGQQSSELLSTSSNTDAA